MGNCKSVSATTAAGGADVQKPEGYNTLKSPKAVDATTAPLIKIDTKNGDKSSNSANISDITTKIEIIEMMEIPTSPTGETMATGISVDDWIGTKPTIESMASSDTEASNFGASKGIQFDPNVVKSDSSDAKDEVAVDANRKGPEVLAPLEEDIPDDEKAADNRKGSEAEEVEDKMNEKKKDDKVETFNEKKEEETEHELVLAGPKVAAPAFQLAIPLIGKIPSSVFQMASDYVSSEFNAMTVGSKTEQKSVWALNPTDIVAGAAATAAAAVVTTSATPVVAAAHDNAKHDENINAPEDEIEVEVEAEDSNPEAVIVSYKQKESQWAIDEVVKPPTKMRGPRPEDMGRRRSTGSAMKAVKQQTSTPPVRAKSATPSRGVRRTPEGQRRNAADSGKKNDPLDFMVNW
mmetsp:Transcript_20550/g.41900  ORF Transcript_20550/g.41900 Transcript_20550/m.41900 type:complete len:406 (-) Transcript_20550:180-1397(-)